MAYDDGGRLPPAVSRLMTVLVPHDPEAAMRRPELVLTQRQWAEIEQRIQLGDDGG